MSFRFNAQTVFLTWSQTKKNMHPQWVLRQMEAKADVAEYLISQERHEDGGYHIHAYFKFTTKLDKRDATFFDLSYYRRCYHPNVQRVKGKYKLFRYIKKDKRFITNIDETRPKWLTLLQDCESEEEFLEEILWTLGRFDNYAGYRSLRDLYRIKMDNKQASDSLAKYASKHINKNTHKHRNS